MEFIQEMCRVIVYIFLNALQISWNIATHYHAYSNPNLYNTIVTCLIIIILSYLVSCSFNIFLRYREKFARISRSKSKYSESFRNVISFNAIITIYFDNSVPAFCKLVHFFVVKSSTYTCKTRTNWCWFNLCIILKIVN